MFKTPIRPHNVAPVDAIGKLLCINNKNVLLHRYLQFSPFFQFSLSPDHGVTTVTEDRYYSINGSESSSHNSLTANKEKQQLSNDGVNPSTQIAKQPRLPRW